MLAAEPFTICLYEQASFSRRRHLRKTYNMCILPTTSTFQLRCVSCAVRRTVMEHQDSCAVRLFIDHRTVFKHRLVVSSSQDGVLTPSDCFQPCLWPQTTSNSQLRNRQWKSLKGNRLTHDSGFSFKKEAKSATQSTNNLHLVGSFKNFDDISCPNKFHSVVSALSLNIGCRKNKVLLEISDFASIVNQKQPESQLSKTFEQSTPPFLESTMNFAWDQVYLIDQKNFTSRDRRFFCL